MEYHQDRYEDHSLMVFKNDVLIAIFPANKFGSRIVSHQGLTYGGFVVKNELAFPDYLEGFKVLLKTLTNTGFSTLELKMTPSIYNELPSDEINYLMFLLEAKMVGVNMLSTVDLRKKINFSKSRINGYKRATKNNLEVREVHDFDDFWNLILIPNLELKHGIKPVHSLREISKLKSRFPENIRQFNVYKDGVIVAGTTIFDTKNVAHSQYISGNLDKNTLGSLDFLHIYLIQEEFKYKPYFDFGISNENRGKNINTGLLYWKEGFGAKGIIQNFYEVNVNNYVRLNHVML